MPLDDLIRAAMRDAARQRLFPEDRDALALLKQIKSSPKEDGQNGS